MTRRTFLAGALAAAASSSLELRQRTGLAHALPPHAGRKNTKPHNCLFIYLDGGLDPILTTDPKAKSEVDSTVDIGYSAKDILHHGNRRFGPLMKPLERWLPDFAFVNGLGSTTLGHPTGTHQFYSHLNGSNGREPTIAAILGQNHRTHAVPHMVLGRPAFRPAHAQSDTFLNEVIDTPKGSSEPDTDFVTSLLEMGPEAMHAIASTQRKHARLLAASPSHSYDRTPQVLDNMAGLIDALSTTKPIGFDDWTKEPSFAHVPQHRQGKFKMAARDFQRILWSLENDVARAITFLPRRLRWDSHTNNWQEQRDSCAPLFAALDIFLERLSKSPQAGSLTIALVSDVGRYPRLNTTNGKDHFPFLPYMLIGRGIRAGTYGGTDRMLVGQAVDEQGKGRATGHTPVLTDIGTSLLHMADIDPLPFGFGGQRLRFLEAAV